MNYFANIHVTDKTQRLQNKTKKKSLQYSVQQIKVYVLICTNVQISLVLFHQYYERKG